MSRRRISLLAALGIADRVVFVVHDSGAEIGRAVAAWLDELD